MTARPRLRAPGLRPRLALAFAALALTPVLLGALAVDRELQRRQTARVDARLALAAQAAVAEVGARAVAAGIRARALAASVQVQDALRARDRPALRRLAAGLAFRLPGGSSVGAVAPGSVLRSVSVLGARGERLGEVVAAVPLDRPLLAALTRAAALPPGYGLVVVRSGRVAAAARGLAGRPLVLDGARARLAGLGYRAASRTLVRGARPSALVALAPRAAIAAPLARLRRLVLLARAATLVGLAALAYAFGRPLMRSLGETLRRAEDAVTDELTGLPNRRALQTALAAELARAGRSGRPLALVMLDVDRFKQVNDTHGHAAGDDVLVAVADVLRAEARAVDLPARQGGEEFVVLVPEADAAGAAELAERIRRTLAAREIPTQAGTLRVTASFGVAAHPAAADAEALLARADEALYAAKHGGRDRVVVAGREPAPALAARP